MKNNQSYPTCIFIASLHSMPPFVVLMPKLLPLHHMMALMKSGVNSTEKFHQIVVVDIIATDKCATRIEKLDEADQTVHYQLENMYM